MSGFELYLHQVAKIAGCHPNTVTNYVRRGLLLDCRDSNGFRRFRLEDALKLKEILEHREVRERVGNE